MICATIPKKGEVKKFQLPPQRKLKRKTNLFEHSNLPPNKTNNLRLYVAAECTSLSVMEWEVFGFLWEQSIRSTRSKCQKCEQLAITRGVR